MDVLNIYNTLSGAKEKFSPLNKDIVTMYVCGPTVYGEPHLGHARPAITFDILFSSHYICNIITHCLIDRQIHSAFCTVDCKLSSIDFVG